MKGITGLFNSTSPGGLQRRREKFRRIHPYVFIALWVSIVSTASAGEPSHEEGVESRLFVHGFFTMPSLSMSVNGEQVEQTWLDPNRIWSIGVGAQWRNLSGSFSVRTPLQVNDPRLYGKTDYFDVQVRFYGKRLGVDGFVQSYKGFFLRDLPATCVRGDPCSFRSELKIQHTGMIVYYAVNPHWSMRSAFNQPAGQKESAGSWFVAGGVNYILLSNDDPLVEGAEQTISDGRFYMASISPGYGYNWVRNKWYFTTALYVGAGPMYAAYSKATTQASPVTEWRLALKAGVKLGAGYSGDIWQAGVRALADAPVTRIGGFDMQWIAQTTEFYLGRQF